jgi:hypothetical protein
MGNDRFCAALLVLISSITQAQTYVVDPLTIISESGRTLTAPFAGGLNNPQFWEAEVNNDGIPDLLVFDRNGGKVLPFVNGGESGIIDLEYRPELASNFPAMEYFVVTADYNCDGLEDIFTSFDDGIQVYQAVPESDEVIYELAIEKLTYTEIGFSFDVSVGIIDIPAFVDVNGDGDLDMLTFKLVGGFVDYFENQAVENGDDCGVMMLEHVNSCWGDFYESGINKAVDLDSTCSESPAERSGMHAGSTFLAFDQDADGDIDLALGDLSFDNINFLRNGGTPELAHISEQDTLYPNYSVPVSITTFPAPFLFDLDNNGHRDLIVAPNKDGFGFNTKNVWWYNNVATDDTYVFEFVHDSLLVMDMIDLGTGAHPFFFDHNADGLLDMVIGNYGYFEDGNFIGRMALYENVGNSELPAFQLVTRNYSDLEIYGFRSLHPTFGDIDADGDIDLLIGEENGFIHLFKNTAGAGATATFILTGPNFQGIDVGKFSTPQLVDVNEDGLLDLIIGEENGNLNFYENQGTASEPVYVLIDELWGGVDVRKPLTLTGYSAPWLMKDADNSWMLYVGSLSGFIYQYDPTDDFTGLFTKLTESFSGIDEGGYTTVTLADISADGIPELLTGNDRGGITLYRDASTIVAMNELTVHAGLQIFPNPGNGLFYSKTEDGLPVTFQVYSMDGKWQMSGSISGSDVEVIDMTKLANGVYFIVSQSTANGRRFSEKVILNK